MQPLSPFEYNCPCREGWQDELKELISKLNISVAFDAIAGEMSGTMMQVATDCTLININIIAPINMININIIIDFLIDQCRLYKFLIQLLPEGSTTVVYGSLSCGKVGFSFFVFVFVFRLHFCHSSLYFPMLYIRKYNILVFPDRQVPLTISYLK